MISDFKDRQESRSICELGSDYFREGAVLVAVFGILEKVVHNEAITFWYGFTMIVVSAILFFIGFYLELLRNNLRRAPK